MSKEGTMDFVHKPVLLDEAIEYLDIKPDGIYVDGTIGGAGHSYEICARMGKSGILVGIDQDSSAIEASRERLAGVLPKVILVNDNFKNIKSILQDKKIGKVNGILLDLGVSSHQLDAGDRGFSYQKDAPLDMRMDRKKSLTAETVINNYPQKELEKIIREYGEEKWASRIAEFIVKRRQTGRITTTGELVEVIKAAIPASARRKGPHPAKRTFQAVRIAVNDELGLLESALGDCMDSLEKDGRLCVITFHSLEDTIVKNVFRRYANPCRCVPDFPVCVCGEKPSAKMVIRKPVFPGNRELEANPRARSAKMRVVEKIIDC